VIHRELLRSTGNGVCRTMMQKTGPGLPTVEGRDTPLLDPHHANVAKGKARKLPAPGTPVHTLYLDDETFMAL